ncbi:MAG: hypothetical protein KIS87_07665 [Phycisphaeraceae bacterium]|nr:hypothetical protein [Phycisphaeraceae bacterium]
MPHHTADQTPRQPQTPVWAIILTSCAVIATAHLLGVPNLTELSLGMPVGLWIAIAIACAWTSFTLSTAGRASWLPRHSVAAPSATTPPTHNLSNALGSSVSLSLSAELLTRAAALMGEAISLTFRASLAAAPAERLRTAHAESLLCSLHDRIRWPVRPLRIGLDLSDADATAITRDPPPFGVRWFRVSDTPDLMAACRRHRLDAVVSRHGTGPVRIVTNERAGRDAARLDWAAPETASLAAVFPHRIDTQGVTIDAPAPLAGADADAVRDLSLAAGALARHPARLGLPDRLFGRRPITDHSAFMHRLADRLDEPTHAERTIARAVSAWAVAHNPPLVERCAAHARTDPAVQLRLAAVRFAGGDDRRALSALMHADRLLRSGDPPARLDHAAFVESELRCGEDAPLTLGRVAVGVCLLCAATPVDRLRFIRDDLDEEMRFAPWLIGRDQDRRLLLEVLRELERCRRADELGLPAAQAA